MTGSPKPRVESPNIRSPMRKNSLACILLTTSGNKSRCTSLSVGAYFNVAAVCPLSKAQGASVVDYVAELENVEHRLYGGRDQQYECRKWDMERVHHYEYPLISWSSSRDRWRKHRTSSRFFDPCIDWSRPSQVLD
ncbi:hypothetical protein EC957_006074 [Mortierella hygrophila]|uniref:Uncharacterized protein n=1 Tax=Mortierella hygrophila TaxID=979708 RepID=A0A9P6JZE2_9FUNG|nr:hypothetical protein EC957_006074 [Mortierella hygrophila]